MAWTSAQVRNASPIGPRDNQAGTVVALRHRANRGYSVLWVTDGATKVWTGTFSLHKATSFNSDDRKHEPPPPTSLHNSVVKLVLRSQSALDDWAGLPGSDYLVPGKE